jgi:hypothetical protein
MIGVAGGSLFASSHALTCLVTPESGLEGAGSGCWVGMDRDRSGFAGRCSAAGNGCGSAVPVEGAVRGRTSSTGLRGVGLCKCRCSHFLATSGLLSGGKNGFLIVAADISTRPGCNYRRARWVEQWKNEGARGGGVKVKMKTHGEGRSERELTLVFKWQ